MQQNYFEKIMHFWSTCIIRTLATGPLFLVKKLCVLYSDFYGNRRPGGK